MLAQSTDSVSRVSDRALAAEDAVSLWLSGRSKATVRAYSADLRAFASWLSMPGEAAAARALLASGPGSANALVTAWRGSMLDDGLSAATVRRRLSAIRSLVGLARRIGLVSWALDVESVRAKPYRDTRGPGRAVVRAMIEAAESADNLRDAAILRLLWNPALRRGELVRMDLSDVDLTGERVRVLGKGQDAPEWVTLPPTSLRALRSWIERRGVAPGPLFRSQRSGARLCGSDIYRLVRRWGRAVGAEGVRPHGLRHSGITAALDATGGNVRAVARFSRHADVRTVGIYDDARRDLAGDVARMVG